jgi:four helix bundle protein
MGVPLGQCFLCRMSERRTATGAEKLRVYNVAVDLAACVRTLVAGARCSLALADQIRRAADSVVLNIAEGAGHYRAGLKAQHYRSARASLSEVVAALELLQCEDPRINTRLARRHTGAIAALLLGLIRTQESRQ